MEVALIAAASPRGAAMAAPAPRQGGPLSFRAKVLDL
jgi:hypothetical protein